MHFESRFDLLAYETKKASDITSVAFHQVNTLFYAKSLPRPCSRTVSGIFQLDLSSCNRMRRNNKSVIIFGVFYYSFRIVDYSILLKRLCGSSKLFWLGEPFVGRAMLFCSRCLLPAISRCLENCRRIEFLPARCVMH